MKKRWLAIVALAAVTAAQGATVTLTLSLHESPTQTATTNNQFAVWATVSNDNGGLYAYSVDMKTSSEGGAINLSSLTNRTPTGTWAIDDGDPNWDAVYALSPGYPTKFGGFGASRGVSALPGAEGTVSGEQDLARGTDLVRLYHAGQPGFVGNMNTLGPKPHPFVYPAGAQRADGTPLGGLEVPFKSYVSGEAVADGEANVAATGARGNLGSPLNPAGLTQLPAGSLRLFTGSWAGVRPTLASIEQSLNTFASVWHDTSGADIIDSATIAYAIRDIGSPQPPPILGVFANSSLPNQAVDGAITVTGSNNNYLSEVDQLHDPSLNRGSASIQTIGAEAGFIWVMAKVTGTAAEVATLQSTTTINNGALADAATAAALHASYDPLFGPGGFNILYRQANYAGAKTVAWDFTAQPSVTVDQLAVVPEPSVAIFFLASATLLAARRR